MEIRRLDREKYAGREFTVHYETHGYYDIRATGCGFALEYVPLKAGMKKSFDDVMFGEWLDNPVAYGAFDGERMLGFAEGFWEKWNNRYRISNICVFDAAERRSGVGTALMNAMIDEAKAKAVSARMAVLETQTCNENAIAFYRKNGFEIIGFDIYAYSNFDPERHEMRLEMGRKLT